MKKIDKNIEHIKKMITSFNLLYLPQFFDLPITGSNVIGVGKQCTCPGGVTQCYKTDPSSCNKFSQCSNGTLYDKECPGERFHVMEN